MFNASEMVAQIREVEALGKDLFVVGKVPGLPALLRLRLASPRFPMSVPPPSPHSSSRARTVRGFSLLSTFCLPVLLRLESFGS